MLNLSLGKLLFGSSVRSLAVICCIRQHESSLVREHREWEPATTQANSGSSPGRVQRNKVMFC